MNINFAANQQRCPERLFHSDCIVLTSLIRHRRLTVMLLAVVRFGPEIEKPQTAPAKPFDVGSTTTIKVEEINSQYLIIMISTITVWRFPSSRRSQVPTLLCRWVVCRVNEVFFSLWLKPSKVKSQMRTKISVSAAHQSSGSTDRLHT